MMKYVDEYRNEKAVRQYAEKIRRTVTRPWNIMEICGGQTHSIVKFGLDTLLPEDVQLIHGPGCPVCVTSLELIDKAIHIAAQPHVIFCSFGDMLRVPGSRHDLFSVKATGGDVRIVYSPLDALELARQNPTKQIVFFAIGFETTSSPNAMAVYQAHKEGLKNFSMLVSQVLVPPAIEAILSSPDQQVQGFLAAGHVCTVTGYKDYEPIAAKYEIPIVVTGFEPLDILQGIEMCIQQLEEGRHEVTNQYTRAVRREGNVQAQQIMHEVFEVIPQKWRGIGLIPGSGLGIKEAYRSYDAEHRFDVADIKTEESGECISGLVLQGLKKPHECAAFGTRCTPEHPLGATMVSSEGACAAYYRYRRHKTSV
jgi:hydrogenase expression/formation protein HypD